MAGIKISALPAVITAQLTDTLPVVQAGVTSKETLQQVATLFNSGSVLTGFVPISGGTMTGSLILSQDPTLPLMAATKEYVDLIASGITVILAAQAATTANLNATQAGAGIGATLTNAGAMVAFAVDGYSASLNDRILVKNQTLTQHNGVYTVTTVGSGAANWVLTRATDYDTAAQIKPGTLVAVNNGTVNATTSWLETATVVTVDTDPVLFSQFTFAPAAFLLKANNLSDVASVATSLVNLGLGVPTGTGNVVLQTSPTLITPILGNATATSLTFSPTTNGIIGTTTNDNALAGRVGEFISSTVLVGSAVNVLNNTATDITSISLSAGDWNVSGEIVTAPAGSATQRIQGWTSTTSATQPIEPNNGGMFGIGSPLPSGAGSQTCMGPMRISLPGTTIVYLSVSITFTGGTMSAYGFIGARRVR